ncbi:shikimate transporter [Salmonella enterica]|nr:shikimate transporter [Salmonella enterica subsp. enterica serovar Corvallis]EBW4092044.1 shikimate transporter [Salmonella enterica subsp. enterica serovar Agona]ECS8468474.1 shikimate transporter [Salmonella enterica]MBE7285003.1 prophage tail fiber N-terminal domain-containing protein [Salmonella enterica subsp. enterica]MCQ3259434.1 prophage tail fiber N-terminal domain-containing protein [Salmonella enterica subsp. enterica serovar Indiana]QPD13878.1 prophage tail fiber N-terminal doma
MPVLISGVLKDATGTPVQNCTIQLKACRTSTTVVVNTVASENPDDAGRYSMDVEQGQYTVTLLVEGYPPSHAGVITVYDDSKPGTLNDFLGAMTEDDVRPEALRRFEAMVEEVARQASEASRNATAAGQASEQAQTSAGQAAESATAAVNAAGAAEASATQAASSAASAESSAGTATTKAGEASASAASADTARTAAAASAAAAKTSETNADASRTAAGDSAAAAAASATAAQTSAERAGASETAAKTSETQAASSAGDAGASATAAAASEKAAAASAAAAKISETNAATSASTAAASATAASSSASEASNHAAASDTSASLAAQSSTAAGAAATRAEEAAKRAEDIADVISLEDASLTKKGIVKLSSATDSDSEALAATPKAVHAVMDEVQTKAPLDSPVFTGTPTTPTPPDDAKGLQTANAEFVRKLIAALVGSVPESLDTLQELADALGNDPNFATTVLNKLAGKQPLDDTLTALSGKSVDGLIEYVGLRETINRAAGAMQKDQNGGDIQDKDLFVRRIGAARAFDGAVNIGGDDNPWTTAEFISWLESCGAFNHPYWMCRGSWSYAHNKIITDTGCGNICLAGAVIEVMGVRGAMTIRITTPTTTSGGGVASAQFTYINNGDGYSPGWRREFSRTGDEMTGNLYLKNDGRVNFCIMNEDRTPRMWLFKDKGGDGVHINNGNDGGGDFIFGKDGSFYASAVRAGIGKKLSLTSNNNSTMTATFNLWGDANRPTVIELDDDQGWQFYSQRNPDGSIRFMVNGEIFTTSSIHAGANTISTDGNIYGSLWGGWLNDWINNTIINRFVQDIRLGGIEYAQAWNGPGYNDTPGYVITGVTNGNSDELIDGVHRRPLQKLIGGVWYNVASI